MTTRAWRDRPLLAVGAFVLVATAELAWRAADRRLPVTDPPPLRWIPDLYWALGDPASRFAAARAALGEPGGWHAGAVALALRVFGRSPAVFELVPTLAWALTVAGAGAIAWAWAARSAAPTFATRGTLATPATATATESSAATERPTGSVEASPLPSDSTAASPAAPDTTVASATSFADRAAATAAPDTTVVSATPFTDRAAATPGPDTAVVYATSLADADRAAALAILLVAAAPWCTIPARLGGAPIVATALATVLLAVAARDPRLTRWASVPIAAFAGALLLAFGPEGWFFAGPVLAVHVLAASAPARGPDGGVDRPVARVLAVLAGWGIGTLIGVGGEPVPGDRAVAVGAPALRDALGRVAELLTRPVAGLVVVGLLVGLVVGMRQRTDAPSETPRRGWSARLGRALDATRARSLPLALLACALAPLAAAVAGGPAPDTLPAAGVALAVLAAVALRRRVAAVFAGLGAWLLVTIPQHLEPRVAPWADAVAPGFADAAAADLPFRPIRFDLPGTLGALLDATCASDAWASCRVVVDQGLAGPNAEDPGRLARFLLAEDRLALATIYDVPRTRVDDWAVDALLTLDCGERDDRFRMRAPDATTRVVQLAAARGLSPAWHGLLGDPGCRAYWLTPRGRVARPERLPATSDVATPWSPFVALASVDGFYARYPAHRNRQGRSSARRAEGGLVEPAWDGGVDAPPGWSAGGAEALRAAARR